MARGVRIIAFLAFLIATSGLALASASAWASIESCPRTRSDEIATAMRARIDDAEDTAHYYQEVADRIQAKLPSTERIKARYSSDHIDFLSVDSGEVAFSYPLKLSELEPGTTLANNDPGNPAEFQALEAARNRFYALHSKMIASFTRRQAQSARYLQVLLAEAWVRAHFAQDEKKIAQSHLQQRVLELCNHSR